MADKDDATEPGAVPEKRFTPEPSGEPAAAGPAPDQGPMLAIAGQYIKDLSFEAPNTPRIFEKLQTTMPNIPIEVDVRADAVGQDLFEVVLKIRAEAKVEEELVYILETEYAGLFNIRVPQEHLAPVLLVECPLIIFPFLRRIVADATSDGGFAPLMLAPIDFASLYQQRMQQQQAQQPQGADGGGDSGEAGGSASA